MKKWQSHPFFRFMSSLKLAVISILTLASVLAVATVTESLYGMRGAHVLVYGQPWFFGILILLGLNVFSAALSRWPWKRHQVGFVITHSGILLLLVGSWITMQYGVDGNLPVVEGFDDAEVILNDLQITVGDAEAGRSQSFPIPETALKAEGKLADVVLPAGHRLIVEQFFPRAKVQRVVRKSESGMGTPAVHVEIFNERFSLDEWILAQEPDSAKEINLGPAILSLQKLWSADQERAFSQGKLESVTPKKSRKGTILVQYEGKEFRVDIDEGMQRWVPVGMSGMKIFIERYLPYAVVEKNQLVNRGKDPVNPTVQLLLRGSDGKEEKHTLFANFPDFATLHKKAKPGEQTELGAKLRMLASAPPGGPGGVTGKLSFGQSANNQSLRYRILGTGSRFLSEGVVEVGKTLPTGWMDLQFRVIEWIPSAVQYEQPIYSERLPQGENLPAAVQIAHTVDGVPSTAADRVWLVEGATTPVSIGDKILEVGFQRDRLKLPFRIHLKKFTMGTDPGTNKAASYESDVVVQDPMNPDAPTAHISMNEPLQYGGYTFYQASYQMREGQPPLSVFSVNRDPGRWVKYGGSIVMVLGILLMFYLNPHYWNILFGLGRKTP